MIIMIRTKNTIKKKITKFINKQFFKKKRKIQYSSTIYIPHHNRILSIINKFIIKSLEVKKIKKNETKKIKYSNNNQS